MMWVVIFVGLNYFKLFHKGKNCSGHSNKVGIISYSWTIFPVPHPWCGPTYMSPNTQSPSGCINITNEKYLFFDRNGHRKNCKLASFCKTESYWIWIFLKLLLFLRCFMIYHQVVLTFITSESLKLSLTLDCVLKHANDLKMIPIDLHCCIVQCKSGTFVTYILFHCHVFVVFFSSCHLYYHWLKSLSYNICLTREEEHPWYNIIVLSSYYL